MLPSIVIRGVFVGAVFSALRAAPRPAPPSAALMNQVNTTLDNILATNERLISMSDRTLADMRSDGVPESDPVYQRFLARRQKDVDFRDRMKSLRLRSLSNRDRQPR